MRPNPQAVAAHVLLALLQAQVDGRCVSLEVLTRDIRVRKGDIRRTITLLHRQGFVDALHMRLTLSGFTLACALDGESIPALRVAAMAKIHAA